MSTWERFRKALRREQRDVEDALDEMKDRATPPSIRRSGRSTPRRPSAWPMQQERAREADDDLDAIKRKIERGRGYGAT